ncbi:MAG: hypothetical protein AAGC93_31500 [Cyanobacteria bacterium P01_F01_bin.53]
MGYVQMPRHAATAYAYRWFVWPQSVRINDDGIERTTFEIDWYDLPNF